LDDDAPPLGDQPGGAATFDGHVADVDEEVDGGVAADGGGEGPFGGVDEGG
jgi:hypothetical protein